MRRISFIIIMLLTQVCWAQRDTEFWFAAPDLSEWHQEVPLYLCITTYDEPADIMVNSIRIDNVYPNSLAPTVLPNSQPLSLPADTFYVIDLSDFVDLIETKPHNTVLDRGIHITATAPISCYYECVGNNSEIYSLKGSNALGTDFVVPMQNIRGNYLYHYSPSSIELVATEDSTEVEITAPVALLGGISAGSTVTVTLQQGHSYAIRANGYGAADHLGGTRIHASHPIAVNSTDDCVADAGCRDLLGDQIVPSALTGQRYVALRNGQSSIEKVFVAPADGSNTIEIRWNGGLGTYTIGGGSYVIDSGVVGIPLTSDATLITTNKPAAVWQMTSLGCEVGGTMLPQIDCTGSYKVKYMRIGHNSVIVNIVVGSDHVANFLFNGNPNVITANDFQPLGGDSSYSWCIKDVSEYLTQTNYVTLENTSGRFQLGILSGIDNDNCSYGYFSEYAKGSYKILEEMDTIYCAGDSIVFNYDAPNVVGLTLYGPNNLCITQPPFVLHHVDSTFSGIYRLEGFDTAACQQAISDSVNITIQKASIRFNMDSIFCLMRDIQFLYDATCIDSAFIITPTKDTLTEPFILHNATDSANGRFYIKGITHATDTLTDSIDIQVSRQRAYTQYDTVAENALPWTFLGQSYTHDIDTTIIIEDTTFEDGCDSIYDYHLRVIYNTLDTVFYFTCPGNLPVRFDTVLFYQEGVQEFRHLGQYGQDSVIVFVLRVFSNTDTTIYDTIVDTQLPWFAVDTSFEDSVSNYVYTTTNEAGCDSVIHYNLYIFWNGDHCDTTLSFPNLVTPNGDGKNDRFVIEGLVENNCFKYNELSIYNRTGRRVYHKVNISKDDDWWDPAAHRIPAGTYFYYFKAHGINIHTQHTGVIEVLVEE